VPQAAFAMFQLTFAIITPALVVGAFAERMRFSVVLWFSAAWLLLVYVPVCHWVWGGGWLEERKGFPHLPMPPHNMPLTVLGAGMLWVGWFGFNGGSALAANGSAAMAILATHLAAAAGALTWMALEWLRFGKPSLLGIVTGTVAGLGTITPASGFVGPGGALVIGIAAGIVCFGATQLLKRKLGIDDSLDVSPVHGVGGILGTLLTAVFVNARLGGVGYAHGMSLDTQLAAQLTGIVATAAWCAAVTYVILKVLDATLGLRVTEDQEREGLDLALHGERGYAD
jgi:ammonium transporter, Amt family